MSHILQYVYVMKCIFQLWHHHYNRILRKGVKTDLQITNFIKTQIKPKLLRNILYKCKAAGGIGLIQPSTAIAMAKIKQYVGNLRIQSNVAENILVNKDFVMKESRYSSIPIENKKKTQFWKKGWIDEVANELQSRRIQITNLLYSNPIKTENRTIIDYTIIYCE